MIDDEATILKINPIVTNKKCIHLNLPSFLIEKIRLHERVDAILVANRLVDKDNVLLLQNIL